jgi:hypothetical protein
MLSSSMACTSKIGARRMPRMSSPSRVLVHKRASPSRCSCARLRTMRHLSPRRPASVCALILMLGWSSTLVGCLALVLPPGAPDKAVAARNTAIEIWYWCVRGKIHDAMATGTLEPAPKVAFASSQLCSAPPIDYNPASALDQLAGVGAWDRAGRAIYMGRQTIVQNSECARVNAIKLGSGNPLDDPAWLVPLALEPCKFVEQASVGGGVSSASDAEWSEAIRRLRSSLKSDVERAQVSRDTTRGQLPTPAQSGHPDR